MNELNERMRALDIHARFKSLPISPEGYPVPFFVAWMKDGKECRKTEPGAMPDFRVIGRMPSGESKIIYCHRQQRCWLCGRTLGVFSCFVVGPMCTVNRASSEPPSHFDCARLAVQACPFLAKPRMRRNDKEMPEHRQVSGLMIERNPGVAALWITTKYNSFKVKNGSGIMFNIGEPTSVEWWAEGRRATRDEVRASMDSGLPILQDMAAKEGLGAVNQLEAYRLIAMQWLPQ